MSRKYQQPEIERPENDPISDVIERHPAYAQIGASRVSGSRHLYGSDFAHQDFVTIRIGASELHRGLSQDWHHGSDRYIEVSLSEAQWASFVSTLNMGSGIPCTLEFLDGKGEIPLIPEPIVSRNEQFAGELADCLAEAEKQAKRLQKLIEEGSTKREMRDAITRLINHLSPNISFVAKQFGEHMETTTERAKIEIGAYIQSAISRAGLAALKGEAPIRLPDGKKAGE